MIKPCPVCHREAITKLCVGGWLIHCKYEDVWLCAVEGEPWCKEDKQNPHFLFESEEEAIEEWNNPSGMIGDEIKRLAYNGDINEEHNNLLEGWD